MRVRPWLWFLLIAAPVWAESPSDTMLDAAITRLWRALSNEPGQAADGPVLEQLLHAEARVFGVNPKRPEAGLSVQSRSTFLEAFSKPDTEGFYEREVYRGVERYGAFAHVFSTVESRRQKDAPEPFAIGVNSLQLYWDGAAWRILSLYYHLEDPAAPIPARLRG